MAKGCNALGGSFRGRVGNATYYVRHGQQIVYERVPRQEHRHVERHPGSPGSMKYAQRWRKQLEDEGVVVELAPLLEFYHSIVRVADGDPPEWLADSRRASWSSVYAYVTDGLLRTYARARDQTHWRDGYLQWGERQIGESVLPTNCWYDRWRYDYPDGSLFCSVIGSIDGELQLVIGRRVTIFANYTWTPLYNLRDSVRAAYYNGSSVATAWSPSAAPQMPTPYNYVYWVDGWRMPNVVGMAAVALPFFIVRPDGVFVEMAVLS